MNFSSLAITSDQEFKSITLGDKRREKRFRRVMQRLFESSGESLSESMGSWCESKAAYRLFDCEELTDQRIFESHREQIKERALGEKELLFIHDTTALNFTSHTGTRGLGSIAQGFKGKNSQGIFAHTAYVLNAQGLPLGILDQLTFSGKGGRGRSEVTGNLCWEDALKNTKEVLPSLYCRAIHVCDREGDYWDLMSEISWRKEFFVIRLIKQRSLKESLNKIWKSESVKVLGEMALKIEHREKQAEKSRYHQKRQDQEVKLAISAVEFDLSFTIYAKDKSRDPALKVYLVRAVEIEPPSDREPIEWILKTNIEVKSFSEALRIVKIYEFRWQIELFHKILKSGCQVEKTRFNEVDRIIRYVAAMSIVAWRLHHMTHINRHDPDSLCTKILSSTEWKALYIKIHKKKNVPKIPPSINQAIRWIAQLGGFMGRKSDGNPGMITVWRGWNKLTEIAEIYQIMA